MACSISDELYTPTPTQTSWAFWMAMISVPPWAEFCLHLMIHSTNVSKKDSKLLYISAAEASRLIQLGPQCAFKNEWETCIKNIKRPTQKSRSNYKKARKWVPNLRANVTPNPHFLKAKNLVNDLCYNMNTHIAWDFVNCPLEVLLCVNLQHDISKKLGL